MVRHSRGRGTLLEAVSMRYTGLPLAQDGTVAILILNRLEQSNAVASSLVLERSLRTSRRELT